MDFSNTFSKEPEVYCPVCGERVYAEYVDNGFGPYSVQVEPYHCENCHWIETGTCKADRCHNRCLAYERCQGRAKSEHSLPPIYKK